jgi:CRISPR-associated protein Cas1
LATCYIDRKDAELRVDGQALACYEGGRRTATIPLGPVDRLVIVGNVSLETRLLHRLAEQGVTVGFIGGRKHRLLGCFARTLQGNGARRFAQYRAVATPEMVQAIATGVLVAKLDGHLGLLESLRPHARQGAVVVESISRIATSRERVADALALDSLRGLEGAAAAAFFTAFQECFPPSLEFTDRNRRPPKDPVNALLSLTYTLVHFELLREVEVAGLDPTLGFLHEVDYGRDSLVCDLVEPQRPAAERFVWGLFHERLFTARDFAQGEERPGCYLKKGGRTRFYPAYEGWADGQRSGWREAVRALVRELGGDGVPPTASAAEGEPS